MTIELLYLTYVAVFTALMWLPYILNQLMVRGITNAVGYPTDPKPVADWATRLKCAHYNAVENLVVFAVLVVVAHLIGTNNETTALCVKVYFYARVVHAIVYTAAVPWARTLAFFASWIAVMALAVQVLHG